MRSLLSRLMDTFPGFMLVFLIAGALIITPIVLAVAYGPVRWSCKNTATVMGLEWRYSLTTDCLVETDQGWIPLDQYRATQEVGR